MNFRTVKNGYDPAEVEQYFKRIREAYDETLVAQRDRIFALKDELARAEKTVSEYDARKEQISRAIESALSKADEIERLTRRKIVKELSALRKFHKRWVEHFAKILRKYPLDDDLRAADEVGKAMAELLNEADSTPSALGTEGFDPVGMIEGHLAAESAADDEQFDYDAALHPDEDLGQILKDLGVLFDDKKR